MPGSNNIKLFSLFFFHFVLSFSFAQNVPVSTVEEFQEFFDKGKAAYNLGDSATALEHYTKAEVLAKKFNLKEKLYAVTLDIGNIYAKFCNYGEALGYYQQALEIAEASGSEDKLPKVLTNIGLLYTYENDFKTALEYYKKAYDLADVKSARYTKPLIAVNIAHIYNETGNYTEAKKILLDVSSISKSRYVEDLWRINYATALAYEGKLKEAESIVLKMIAAVERKKYDGCYTCITELLSTIYDRQNKPELAISYAKKGLDTSEMNDKIDLYDQLYRLYFKQKDFTIANQYKDSVFYAKDSLSALMNRGLYESNKVKLKVQDYENELRISQEKQIAERKLFIMGIGFCVLLFLFVYRGLKNKILKQRQASIIADNQQKIFNLELDNLKNKIAEKNRTLSAKALYLSTRNELIEEVINALGQIPEINKNKEISEYIQTLRSYLKTDAEWENFVAYFKEINPEFIRTLKTKHPDLSTSDIKFICYVFMNLDTKEIGNIFNITYNASRKRKLRIQEKMGIERDESLYEYLLQVAGS